MIRTPGRKPLPGGAVPLEWAANRALFSSRTQDGAIAVPRSKWRSLFDGSSLKGWVVQDKNDLWVVEGGTLHCKGGGGGYLRTEQQFEDFAFACEAKIDKGVNSGIFVRWSDPKDAVNTGIEVQVIDSAGKTTLDKHDSGALYDLVAPTANTMKPAGEWNRYVITCVGPFVTARLNGAVVADMNLDDYPEAGKSPDGTTNKFKYAMAALPRKGYIGLQNHGGKIWFRNLMVLPL
ncbi:MAG TPA: DUF1080 domain-containing protein [Armatimonadaceae bacterium]|nr:DUF1080 domain-containing protein [Armatimonadaceae bacterium]